MYLYLVGPEIMVAMSILAKQQHAACLKALGAAMKARGKEKGWTLRHMFVKHGFTYPPARPRGWPLRDVAYDPVQRRESFGDEAESIASRR